MDAAKSFQSASEDLKRVAEQQGKVTFLEEAGLTKKDLLTSLEDTFLKSRITRAAYNQFFALKNQRKEDKAMAKALGMDQKQFKRYKRQVAEEKATTAFEEQRRASLTALVGEEQAERSLAGEKIRAESEQLRQEEITAIQKEAREIEDVQERQAFTAEQTEIANAEADNREFDLQKRIDNTQKESDHIKALNEITDKEKELQESQDIIDGKQLESIELDNQTDDPAGSAGASLDDVVGGLDLIAEEVANSSSIEGSSDAGISPAERDKAAKEQVEFQDKQINILEKIAANISGSGGGAGDGGDSGGDGGGKKLAGLGKGIGGLGKGIGTFLKSVGSGAGKLITSLAKGFASLGKALGPIGKGIGKAIGAILRGFASGVMAFANPLVIGGLAVFTLGMIGLGAALRIAAPAFEAIAPIITRVAEIIGVTLMTAIKEIPAIFESIGNVIEKVGGVIIGIVEAVGGAVGGVVTSIAEGIATVVNAFKGDAMAEANAAIKQAEAATALIESQTSSIERLAKIDSTVLQLTAAGIQAIGEAMQSIGGGVKIPFFTKESPVAGLIELAKNSGGILDASSAVNMFVKNAELLKEGVEIDDSIIVGIEKIVKALGSGNAAGLGAFANAMASINNLDTTQLSLLQGIKIPEIMPQTAAEYEKIFTSLQKTEPSKITKVQDLFETSRAYQGKKGKNFDLTGGRAANPTIQPGRSPSANMKMFQANEINSGGGAGQGPATNNVAVNAPQTSSVVNNSNTSNTVPVQNMPTSHSASILRRSLDF